MAKTPATPSSKSSPKKCQGTCGMRRVLNGEGLCRQCAPTLGTLPPPKDDGAVEVVVANGTISDKTPAMGSGEECQGVALLADEATARPAESAALLQAIFADALASVPEVPPCSDENPLGSKSAFVEALAEAAGVPVLHVELDPSTMSLEDLAGVPTTQVVFAHVSRFSGLSGNSAQRRKARRAGKRAAFLARSRSK